jgi:hypothetical protein
MPEFPTNPNMLKQLIIEQEAQAAVEAAAKAKAATDALPVVVSVGALISGEGAPADAAIPTEDGDAFDDDGEPVKKKTSTKPPKSR